MSGLDPEFLEALQSSRARIDRATAEACERIVRNGGPGWSAWEIEHGLRELEVLSRGGDCTYDRPSIGVSYALWYQGKRTHDALRILAPRIAEVTEPLRIVDLGCGTGATACAVALIVDALEWSGSSMIDEIVVDGVDSSPFMIEVASEIFAALTSRDGSDRVRATFRSAPWTSVAKADGATTAIFGGYLLDHSDGAHADEIARRLSALGDNLAATSILLTTTTGKRSQLRRVDQSLGAEWVSTDRDYDPAPAVGRGVLDECHLVRAAWYEDRGIAAKHLWKSRPAWSGDRPPASLTVRRTPGGGPTLFDDPHRLHDEQQAAAARPDGGPTVIVGAAGSGKSVVLSERIALTIMTSLLSQPAPTVLVTAFNKAVVDLIVEELVRSLDKHGVTFSHPRQETGDHVLDVSARGRTAHVELMNRDKLPKRVFEVTPPRLSGKLRDHWKQEIDRRKRELDAADAKVAAALDHEFLQDEFERVIYALTCFSRLDYMSVDRVGRRTRMLESTREVIWRLLMEPPIDSFVHRRIRAYRQHEAAVAEARPAQLGKRWTHVFVDECQDFTQSDIRLLARVPQDPRNLCIAGDASQSIHLARSYRRPGIAGVRWKRHTLKGSYRLPLRVCEALQPLAEDIRGSHLSARLEEDLDTVLLLSRKAAVPGFRPIVLTGESMGGQLADILRDYVASSIQARLLVADCGRRTRAAVERSASGSAWTIETGGMHKYKGLEWPGVVVTDERTTARDDTSEAASERLFTAMTRTTSLLLIVLWRDGDPNTRSLLGRLDSERLLFWDERAEQAFEHAQRASRRTLPR